MVSSKLSSKLPCALAIGGLDPGGGAGIAADLRSFAAAGAFGCAALAVLTVQSTAGLRRVSIVRATDLTAQVDEVMKHQRVRSVKVGALGGRANVRAVAKLLEDRSDVPAVVDVPMVPTRGKGRLLAAAALSVMREELAPRATLLTANLDEVQALFGHRVRTVADAAAAARELASLGARAALVKGGHMTGRDAVDVLAIEGEVIELRARRLRLAPTHGSGCTFASLVAGRLAVRPSERVDRGVLLAALRWAKRVHHAALARAVDVGGGLKVIAF